MSTVNLQQRLNSLFSVLVEARFLDNQGIGNEIGIYIFDYDPEGEPIVQKHLPALKSYLQDPPHHLKVLEINLYRIILDLLRGRKLLDKALTVEKNEGNANFALKIKPMIRPEQVISHIKTLMVGDERLIFLTGVGASYPLLRSHTILNNLHSAIDRTPLVMFFPGSYDGHELRLFNILKDDNYYRAFPLIPEPQVS